jgi:hypothetical protein
MGLFDIFKRDRINKTTNTDNGILGPTYLENVTIHIDNPKGLEKHEWRRKLSINGQTKFRIKYYGQLHDNHKNLIVGTDYSRPLIYAIEISTNKEILLWDGCKFGYDPIFCDTFTKEQIESRNVDTLYLDSEGKDTFEIIVSTYNGIDYDDEFIEEVDSNGCLETESGQKIKFEEAKRNGFDCLFIKVLNENGKETEIVEEELA